MITQLDPLTPWPIRRWGCYFLVLGKGLEDATGHMFTPRQALWTAVECLGRQFVSTQFEVKKPDAVLAMWLDSASLGPRWLPFQIGADGDYWMWVKDRRIDFTALKYHSVNKAGEKDTHFRLGDKEGRPVWDPDPVVHVRELASVIYYQITRRTT